MKNLRLSLFLLVAQITFLFNIERLDLQEDNLLNLESYVYVLVFLAVISVIVIPALWRFKVFLGLTLWLGVYAAIKAIRVSQGEVEIVGFGLYLTIVEVSMIALSVFLAYNVSIRLHDVEDTLQNIFLIGGNSLLRTVTEADVEIQREIYRSRRFGHPLSLVLVDIGEEPSSPQLNQIIEDFQKSIRNHYVVVSISRAISNILRRTDLLVDNHGHGSFVLLAPETDLDSGHKLAERIEKRAQKELGIDVRTSVVAFPQDALTFEELVAAAQQKIDTKGLEAKDGAVHAAQQPQ